MVEPTPTPEPDVARRTPLVVALVIVSVLALVAVGTVIGLARRDTGTTITAETPTTTATATSATPTTTTGSTATTRSTAATTITTGSTTRTTAAPRGIDRSGLGVEGLAPLRLGMTLAEAEAAAGITTEPSQCGGGVSFTVDGERVFLSFDADRRIAAILVKSSNISTLSGIRVGDPADAVRRTYAGQGSLTEKPYGVPGSELLVYRSSDPADADHEVVFWVENGTVVSIVAATGTAGEHEPC